MHRCKACHAAINTSYKLVCDTCAQDDRILASFVEAFALKNMFKSLIVVRGT